MVDENSKKNTEEHEAKKSAEAKEETKVEVKPEADIGSVEEKEETAIKEEKKAQEESKLKKETIEKKEIPEKKEKRAEQEDEAEETRDMESPAYLNDLNFYLEIRKDLPQVKIGDLIDVSYLVVEGGKERLQEFRGTVIAKKGVGISRTMTVRKTSYGIGVERIFPLNSKFLKKLKIRRHSKVRRAKLYYLRKLKGKASRLKELR